MKKIIVTSLFACSSLLGFAQSSISESGCGTITTAQELQEVYDFVKSPAAASKTTAVDTIPVTIHIVGKDDGSGYYKLDNLFPVMCQLNAHYAPVNFYFSIKFPIHYINNSSYYEHDYNAGYEMMANNNVNKTVNIYFVQDPNGNCGYYAPAGGAVAISKSCAYSNSTTLVHELGHFFGLPHTFSGWEGRDLTNPPSNPEKVTRGAGSNCSSTGDGFCDTDADYLSGRWNCPYTGTATDANGDAYKPDGSLYMSYSNDACMTHFSPQQIARMQNRLATTYSNLRNLTAPPYTVFATPAIVYPVDKIYSNYTKLVWKKVPGAEMYQVKIKQGVITRLEEFVADTSLNIDFTMNESASYVISIVPMNGVNVCRTTTQEKTVTYSSGTTTLSVNDVAAATSVTVSPNPATSQLTVQMNDFAAGKYNVIMTSINGQQMYQQAVNHPGGDYANAISVNDVPAGMYFIRITGEGKSYTQKVVVQH